MLIPIERQLLQQQDYDSALRSAADRLSASGVRNHVHYSPARLLELTDEKRWFRPVVDHVAGGIWVEPIGTEAECGASRRLSSGDRLG